MLFLLQQRNESSDTATEDFDSKIRFNDYFLPQYFGGIKELSHTPTDGLHYVTDLAQEISL